MPKILSKSGDSLADVYDVVGSIAGVEELVSHDVNLVHEMGGTIQSERLRTRIFEIATGAIAQDITFAEEFSGLGIARLLGIAVIETGAIPGIRVTRCQVSITSPATIDDSDMPIWYWDTASDGQRPIQMNINGTTTLFNMLVPAQTPLLPNLLVGNVHPGGVWTMSLKGLTASFGAGTTQVFAKLYMAFPEIGGVSSRGLPLPGW